MIPDRTNYEIWLIDYLDGNLDSCQVGQLLSFLDKNPDIKEEFDEITQYSITPDYNTFPDKKRLKRSVSDISESQFEYLCIAASEKDLSDLQAAEVEEIITESPQKRESYELFLKLKLTPPDVKYVKKHKLRKLTFVQRAIRLSALGLSAAATVAIMISLSNIFIKKNVVENSGSAISNFKDTNTIMINPVKIAVKNVSGDKKSIEKSLVGTLSSLQKLVTDTIKLTFDGSVNSDSSVRKYVNPPISLSKISFKQSVNLSERLSPGTLVAINIPFNYTSEEDDNRGVSGFIARTLREKILKTNDQERGKLKVYEIADAGILGLNKLFGWQMSLHKNKNEKGEIKSFYFSSKLLKFNVPVKKTASLP